MTRPEKIQKLANAIKAYRGAKNVRTGKWVHLPRLEMRQNIVRWLTRLGRTHDQIEIDAVRIDLFATRAEFDAWIAVNVYNLKLTTHPNCILSPNFT